MMGVDAMRRRLWIFVGWSISERQVISRYVFCWSSVILSLQVIVLPKLTWTRNQIFLYTPVPFTTLLSFICVALVPTLVLTTQTPSIFPYLPCLPFPIFEAVTVTALWFLSYLLRDFLYATALFVVSFFLVILSYQQLYKQLPTSFVKSPSLSYLSRTLFQTTCTTSNEERRHI